MTYTEDQMRETTPWFDKKPVRRGVYERAMLTTLSPSYAMWDGTMWREARPTPFAASGVIVVDCDQTSPWRGLTKGQE